MVNLNKYTIFTDHIKSLKEISADDADQNNIVYMTESSLKAVDFDAVKDAYQHNLKLEGEHARSVDAVITTDNSIVFIEFKNGDMKNQKAPVKEKLRDSLLIFGGITGTDINFDRENVDFVLVYNEDKNPLPNQFTKGMVQSSPSLTFIAKHIAQRGKEEFVLFDLDRFKHLYFREVHTYTVTEFENYLTKLKSVIE